MLEVCFFLQLATVCPCTWQPVHWTNSGFTLGGSNETSTLPRRLTEYNSSLWQLGSRSTQKRFNGRLLRVFILVIDHTEQPKAFISLFNFSTSLLKGHPLKTTRKASSFSIARYSCPVQLQLYMAAISGDLNCDSKQQNQNRLLLLPNSNEIADVAQLLYNHYFLPIVAFFNWQARFIQKFVERRRCQFRSICNYRATPSLSKSKTQQIYFG